MAAAKKKEGPSRVYLLWGQEEIRKKDALRELIEALVPPEDRDLDVEYVDALGQNVTAEAILHAVRDRAMFSERRVVIVINAHRLRGNKHQRTQDVLAESLDKLPDYSTLILVAGAEDQDERKGKAPFLEKLMTALKKHGEVRSFPLMKPDELAELAIREAASLGKRFNRQAAVLTAQRAGPDSLTVLQETRKLAAYAGENNEITVQDVNTLVSPRPDDSIWDMLDATFSGDRKRALQIMADLRQSGVVWPVMVTMLARSIRQLVQAKLMLAHKIGPKAELIDLPPELAAQLPAAHLYVTPGKTWARERKLWPQAQNLSWEQLHTALDRLTVTEAGLKGWDGAIGDEELALEVFVNSVSGAVRRR
jgi:DNA polymerase III subunit delta